MIDPTAGIGESGAFTDVHASRACGKPPLFWKTPVLMFVVPALVKVPVLTVVTALSRRRELGDALLVRIRDRSPRSLIRPALLT
jgi:hypothetical protein